MDLFAETKLRKLALEKILESMKAGNLDNYEVENYLRDIIAGFVQNRKNENMQFFSLEDPSFMPSDARVEYVYEPTYFACGVMMYAMKHYPEIMELKFITTVLHDGLTACTGRKFLGHGYDDIKGFLQAMTIFADCQVLGFVEQYPEFNTKFTDAFFEAVEYLKRKICTGEVIEPWSNTTYVEKAIPILHRIICVE